MEDCVFCKIVRGELPARKVYEDDSFLAFIDTRPETPGHAQVIPKAHYRWIWEVPDFGAYFEVVKKIAQAQQKAFGTDWIIQKSVGDEVHHAHVWVFPGGEVGGDKNDLDGNAAKLRRHVYTLYAQRPDAALAKRGDAGQGAGG
jgi:histidine triad (HIT) family protein